MRMQNIEFRIQNAECRRFNIMAVILAFVMAFLGSATLQAQESEQQLFDAANAAYNDGDFEKAIEGYTKIEDLGKESAILFFNKANAYYKLKNYPMSILYYEKALVLDPTNEDIKANLQIANLTKVDKIDPVPQSVFVKWWRAVKESLGPNAWAWLSLALLFLALASLLVFFLSRIQSLRKAGFFLALVFFVVFVFAVIFAAQSRHDYVTHDDAIIVTPSVTMMSAPTKSGQELLILHEGTKVKVLERMEEWNKVRLSDGNVGWIKAEEMKEY